MGEFQTKEKAKLRGMRLTAKTLAASFRVTHKNKPISLIVGGEFRRAKREPKVYVEKRKYRLDTPSEIEEILKARKKKGKKRKKKNNPKKFKWF